jgi:hypothetical protein
MPRHMLQGRFSEELHRAGARAEGWTGADAPEAITGGSAAALPVSRRRAPRATFPGPSRRITVEPLTVPAPSPAVPVPVTPEIDPAEEPRPDRAPVPMP